MFPTLVQVVAQGINFKIIVYPKKTAKVRPKSGAHFRSRDSGLNLAFHDK
jgi:hypothetical protein